MITTEALPRERLLQHGPGALSDEDLLAVILGTGSAGYSVFDLSRELLNLVNARALDLRIEDLKPLRGLGPKKSAALLAAFEFMRRRIRPEGSKISTPQDLVPLLHPYSIARQEHFICISLNGAHEVISTRVISVGLVDRTHVHPREVFADVLTERAVAVILAHNHPSGSLEPSSQDYEVTKQLVAAGRILGIKVLDHVIVGKRSGLLSLREKTPEYFS